jgi:hypothetical protein
MPESFDLTTDSEALDADRVYTAAAATTTHYLTVYGRLKGRDATRVRVNSTRLMACGADFPQDDETISFGTVPFVEQFIGDYRHGC